MIQDETTTPLPPPRQRLRLVPAEWCCLDCGRLSYGRSATPRCPACLSPRLQPTVDTTGALTEPPLLAAVS